MATRRTTTRTTRTSTGSQIGKYIIPAAALGIAAFLLWPKKANAAPAIVPAPSPPLLPPAPVQPLPPGPNVQQAGAAAQQAGAAGGAAAALGAAGGLDPASAAAQAQLDALQGLASTGQFITPLGAQRPNPFQQGGQAVLYARTHAIPPLQEGDTAIVPLRTLSAALVPAGIVPDATLTLLAEQISKSLDGQHLIGTFTQVLFPSLPSGNGMPSPSGAILTLRHQAHATYIPLYAVQSILRNGQVIWSNPYVTPVAIKGALKGIVSQS